LLKEYKREVNRYIFGARDDYPPFPENYFTLQTQAILDEYKYQVFTARQKGEAIPAFPEPLIVQRLHNTWHDTAEAVINNWIGIVYQITNSDRKLPFMEGVDPGDPLGLK
jgi:homoserine O-succinyltransferase